MSTDPLGKVFLIGAGPGDPELMTLKAARALASVDVVLVDELVDRNCLAYARAGARVIEVGKRAGCKSTSQEFIEHLMIRLARGGEVVARLKGGDPMVFGRGGEELRALNAAGVAVEVIPGVTSGIAIPAALGIPLTDRETARAVTFVTGHTNDGSAPDWQALVRSHATLVIYMGLARLKEICGALLDAGMADGTPACAVENGTLMTQRQVVTTLGNLASTVSSARFGSPTIVVVGEVVRHARCVPLALPKLASNG